jgi:hypothetical protein
MANEEIRRLRAAARAGKEFFENPPRVLSAYEKGLLNALRHALGEDVDEAELPMGYLWDIDPENTDSALGEALKE